MIFLLLGVIGLCCVLALALWKREVDIWAMNLTICSLEAELDESRDALDASEFMSKFYEHQNKI